MREKEDEKVEKYQDLAREVRKMWGVRTKVIPVVVGALGSIPLRLKDNLRGRHSCWTDPEMCIVGVGKNS